MMLLNAFQDQLPPISSWNSEALLSDRQSEIRISETLWFERIVPLCSAQNTDKYFADDQDDIQSGLKKCWKYKDFYLTSVGC